MSGSVAIARLRRLRRVAPVTRAEPPRESVAAPDSVFARIAFFTEQDHWARRPGWLRFPAASAASGIVMFLLLLGFTFVLRPRVRALPRTTAIVATLIEPPAPKVAEPKTIAPTAAATVAPEMKPRHATRHHPRPAPKAHPVAPPPIPKSAVSSLGSIPVAPSKEAAPPAPAASGPAGESGGEEAGVGGSESSGARAIYAPLPEIPDDLRQDAFSAVAVAHFVVGSDGAVQVTLTKPTPDPRLNELLLETLHDWKFFPAIKDGVAIASQFDVRIPISVQ